jgi:hypothetical protein
MAKPALDTGKTKKVADVNGMNLSSFVLVGFHFNLCSASTVTQSTWLLHQQDHCRQCQTNVIDKMVIVTIQASGKLRTSTGIQRTMDDDGGGGGYDADVHFLQQ